MEKLWKDLLSFKKEIDTYSGNAFESLQAIFNDDKSDIIVNSKPVATVSPSILISTSQKVSIKGSTVKSYKLISDWYLHIVNHELSAENTILFLRQYLPYCLASVLAKKQKKAFVISHFAQTLDGKIATSAGRSMGIGNEENLIHSHRMRALCDGIMIGRKTYEIDTPQLTVRHVKGNNPAKIVISKDNGLKDNLKDESIFWICSSNFSEPVKKYIPVNQLKDGILNCSEIAKKLYDNGIFSVYLEGGAYTTSQFLASGNINIIQLHISPIIFGTGIQNFNLFPINEISEGISFNNFQYFNIGNEIMFVGELK